MKADFLFKGTYSQIGKSYPKALKSKYRISKEINQMIEMQD